MNFDFIKGVFLKNLPYKIVALILTIVLWIFIAKEKDLEIGLKARLIIKTKPGLVVSTGVPGEINVRVSGPKIFLQPLLFRQFEVDVDLSEMEAGETTFNIVKSMLDMPWGVKVVSINPSSLVAKIEKVQTKKVAIKPKFVGKLPLGFSMKSHQLEVNEVEISGPKDIVSTITQLETSPINLDSIKESFSKNYPLDLPSPYIVVKNLKSVRISAVVTEDISTKTFKRIKLAAYNCIFRCKIDPRHIYIKLKGPMKILKDLTNKDLDVYLDAATKPKGKYKMKAVIKLPARTQVIDVNPIYFKLTVF